MKKIISMALTLCLMALSLSALAAMEIVTPEAYRKNGTLPVYRAVKRDLTEGLDPKLFNQTGIAKQDKHQVVFNDEAELGMDPEALFYQENHGTFDANAKENNGIVDLCPLPAMSDRIASLASWAHFGFPGTHEIFTSEKEQLTHISLADAQKALEELLDKLNVKGYRLNWWLDMSVERIHTLGGKLNAAINSGALFTNIPECDYTAATEDDEGFYLRYERPGFERNNGAGGMFGVTALVTRRGVVNLTVRDGYQEGEVYGTPEKLIPAEDAVETLKKAVASSRYGGSVRSVEKAELQYTVMRAPDKKDGMVLSPVWVISYQDEESNGEYACWAEISAVDGKVVDAIFN